MGPERDVYIKIQEQNEESEDIAFDEILQEQNEAPQETIIFEK